MSVKCLLCINTVRRFLWFVSFNCYVDSYKEDTFEVAWLGITSLEYSMPWLPITCQGSPASGRRGLHWDHSGLKAQLHTTFCYVSSV